MERFQDHLEVLRREVLDAGHAVTGDVLDSARAFMADCAVPAGEDWLAAFAPDYALDEYVLVVHADGTPAPCELPDAVALYDPVGRPLFRRVQEGNLNGLCVARWLAHLAGFRHRAVHLFLDHPRRPDDTLLQLRSFSKCGYPGCFDIPIGGHVKELTPVEMALGEELEEELGLSLQGDTKDVRPIAVYEHVDTTDRPAFRDVEARLVFAGHLNAGAIERAHFPDGEVGALCVFAVAEVAALVERHPERVASGLLGSFGHYLAWRAGGKGLRLR